MKRSPVEFSTATALVTGAGSGIGRATSLALAEKGVTVICTDIDEVAAAGTAAACNELAKSYSRKLDVADRNEVDRVAALVDREHGPLTILVNNAGVGMTGSFSDMSAEDWSFIRSINLDGVINCTAAFTPPMRQARHGQVVIVSSGLAFLPTAKESAYGATKAATLHLAQSLRADFAPAGIGVTAICPGFINTPIAQSTRMTGGEDAKARQRMVKGYSHAHSPEKVGGAIVRAIGSNRAVVPVGFEAVLGWYVHRLTPIAFQQLVARLSGRR
jgi:2-hydroxycyclohexanecarboxyl-CoA dehydrogenase